MGGAGHGLRPRQRAVRGAGMEAREVANHVDDLLMEQGEYVPVELLLRLGQLAYSDYEAWRRAALPTLAGALQDSPERIAGLLEDAAAHCRGLGLEAQCRSFAPWKTAVDTDALHLAHADALADLLATGYRPVPERAQMDLFFDTRGTVLENRLREELATCDGEASQSLLAKLTEQRPDHPALEAFGALVDGVFMPANPPQSAGDYLHHIDTSLEPYATDCLGADARDYLAPHWRTLGGMLEGMRFDRRLPRLHRSYSAARLGYWEEVRGAVEATPGWWRQPVLIERLWGAAEHLREPQLIRRCMCLLCWDHPTHAAAVLSGTPSLAAAYRMFTELDEFLETTDFPAWHALRYRQCLPDVAADNQDAVRIAAVVNALITAASRAPGGTEEISQRRALQEACPALFRQYMT